MGEMPCCGHPEATGSRSLLLGRVDVADVWDKPFFSNFPFTGKRKKFFEGYY